MWSTDADDAKMLQDIPFPINFVPIDQLALNLFHICSITHYRCYVDRFYASQKLGIAKVWLAKFCRFNFKTVYLIQFSTDFNNLDLSSDMLYPKFKILKLNKRLFFYC